MAIDKLPYVIFSHSQSELLLLFCIQTKTLTSFPPICTLTPFINSSGSSFLYYPLTALSSPFCSHCYFHLHLLITILKVCYCEEKRQTRLDKAKRELRSESSTAHRWFPSKIRSEMSQYKVIDLCDFMHRRLPIYSLSLEALIQVCAQSRETPMSSGPAVQTTVAHKS